MLHNKKTNDMNNLYFVQLFKKKCFASHNVDIALGCSFRVVGRLF
jgi:hypothetical protein